MSQLQNIFDDKQLIAIVIPKDLEVEGSKFITPLDFPFQVGLLAHPAKTELKAHSHKKLKIETDIFQEVLIILTGKVEIDLYGMDNKLLTSVFLDAGDSILFVEGGHGVRIIDDARILEVKQGPYPGDAEAKIFIDK